MSSHPSNDRDALELWLCQWLERALERPPGTIERDAHFRSLGMSSIQAVDLSTELEDYAGVLVDPGEILQHPSVERLADLIAQQR